MTETELIQHLRAALFELRSAVCWCPCGPTEAGAHDRACTAATAAMLMAVGDARAAFPRLRRNEWGWTPMPPPLPPPRPTPRGAAWVGFDFGLAAAHRLDGFGPRWRVVFRNGIVLEVYT